MTTPACDLLIIGGGINGAAVARDAAGRGLKVVLAERGDYACATSSASSKLIHGGLRYLEHYQFGLVRESLREREIMLRLAPHLVHPMRFLVPVYRDSRHPAWLMRFGIAVYDMLGGSRTLARSGRLPRREMAALPRLRADGLTVVLQYTDCQVDDARLVLATLLDARARGADIANRREVLSIRPRVDGYSVELRERSGYRTWNARFVVNAAGPWVNRVIDLCPVALAQQPLRLVRGSHILLPMPTPRQEDAFTLQNVDGRIVFVSPWLDPGYLMIGTTDVPQVGNAGGARCSDEERDYLLDVYNRHFVHPGGAATTNDIVWSFAGVRALVDDGTRDLSKITREVKIVSQRQGAGGFLSIYGGKLTTHRSTAEKVMRRLARMGCPKGRSWTRKSPLVGGRMSRVELEDLARSAPMSLHPATVGRWVATYGDVAAELFESVRRDPQKARNIAPRILVAELEHAVSREDALTAEDFLYRRTRLFLALDAPLRRAVDAWFASV